MYKLKKLMFSSFFSIPQNETNDSETPFANYSSSENNSKEDGSWLIQDNSNDFSLSILDNHPMITVEELKKHYKIGTNKERSTNEAEKESIGSGVPSSNEMTGETRNPLRKDNMRKKIKGRAFNTYLYDKLEKLRRSIKCKNYFMKFLSLFVKDIDKKRNKNYLILTIKEIMTNEGFYKSKNDLEKYQLNLKIVESKKIQENEEFQKILNMTYLELIEEYINSDEFK